MTLEQQIADLWHLSVPELTARYAELFGRPPRSRNVAWLRKRVAFRLQQNAFGGLPGPALAALERLMEELQLPNAAPCSGDNDDDARQNGLTMRPGTVLQREWHGEQLRVEVLSNGGFAYEGEDFRSLSAVAKRITGQHWSGPRFFGMTNRAKP